MLRVEKVGHAIVWTIDRPEAKNALDHRTLADLAAAIADARADASVRAAVLTGAGETFVSGGDLRELRGKDSREDAERFSDLGWALTRAIGELPFPVIAALPGPAIGGGAELALACDMRIAEPRAHLSFKQTRMGVTTAWGTVPRLLALVSAGAAARLLFTGHEISAADARAIGLVDDVAPDARATALAWADDIALGSPSATAAMKSVVREALARAATVRDVERSAFASTWSGADHREAVEAYFERRRARFAPRRT